MEDKEEEILRYYIYNISKDIHVGNKERKKR